MGGLLLASWWKTGRGPEGKASRVEELLRWFACKCWLCDCALHMEFYVPSPPGVQGCGTHPGCHHLSIELPAGRHFQSATTASQARDAAIVNSDVRFPQLCPFAAGDCPHQQPSRWYVPPSRLRPLSCANLLPGAHPRRQLQREQAREGTARPR